VGLSAALAARIQNRRVSAPLKEPYLAGVALFLLLVLGPLSVYLLLTFPAWSLLYTLSPEGLAWWVVVAVPLSAFLMGAAGYLLGMALCRRQLDWLALCLSALLLAGLVIAGVLSGDRLSRLSEDLNFAKAPGLLSTPLAAVLAFALPVTLAGWIFLLAFYYVEGRKMLRAREPATGMALQPEFQTSAYPKANGQFERLLHPEGSGQSSSLQAEPAGSQKSLPGLAGPPGEPPKA
jgi:hypothetical protein